MRPDGTPSVLATTNASSVVTAHLPRAIDAAPLVALGIMSAAAYRQRRDALRQTWLTYPEVTSGTILARFVVARPTQPPVLRSNAPSASALTSPGLLHRSETAALNEEARTSGDVTLLTTGVSGRVWSPLHTTFGWFRLAATTRPFRDAPYVAKMDDDAFLNAPEYVRLLDLVRRSPLTAPPRDVYLGVLFWGTYRPKLFLNHLFAYQLLGANKRSAECIRDGTCVGAFPFTTGSMQLLSQQLARRLAGSALAAEHIESSRPLLGAARKQSAFEDVWLGYALYSLVPSAQNITIVGIDRFSYYFDQTTRPMMTNSTILVHLAGDKDGRRIKHVYNFSQRQHCASNGALDCVPFKAPRCPQGPYYALCQNRSLIYHAKYSSVCNLRPDYERCPKSRLYATVPAKSRACRARGRACDKS